MSSVAGPVAHAGLTGQFAWLGSGLASPVGRLAKPLKVLKGWREEWVRGGKERWVMEEVRVLGESKTPLGGTTQATPRYGWFREWI